jgi:hypothetical protein
LTYANRLGREPTSRWKHFTCFSGHINRIKSVVLSTSFMLMWTQIYFIVRLLLYIVCRIKYSSFQKNGNQTLIEQQCLHQITIVLSEDITTYCPSMLTAVQYTILPSSFIFPVYVSTLYNITLPSLQSVLQASGCGEAEVVILVVDKYHCIPLDGHAAFAVPVNVWSLFETTSTGFVSVGVDTSVTDDVGTKTTCYHLNWFCIVMAVYLLHKICISIWS